MVLGHKAILQAIEEGKIYVDPFDPKFVKTNSIDVRLADEVYKLGGREVQLDIPGIPFDSTAHVVDPFGSYEDQFSKMNPTSVLALRRKYDKSFCPGIPANTDAYLLNPGHYVMRTMEWIGAVPGSGLLPDLDSKSTTARWGLTTALCAGRGDVGFTGVWGLSVRISVPTIVIPGMVVSQVRFTRVEGDDEEFAYGGDNSYQPSKDVVRILPKAMKWKP